MDFIIQFWDQDTEKNATRNILAQSNGKALKELEKTTEELDKTN